MPPPPPGYETPPPPSPSVPPSAPSSGGADALTAPRPAGYPRYPSATPDYGVPFGMEARPAPAPAIDPDRRSGGEMVELYIAGSFYGVMSGVWLATMFGDPEDASVSSLVLLFGAGGALGVLGADQLGDGFRTGVPASIAMGALIGFGEGLALLASFEDSFGDATSAVGLVWGATTVGAAAGALVGTSSRPSIGDSRLVASTAIWGAYLAGLASIAGGAEGEEAGRWVLGGLNAGLGIGLLIAPALDLDGGQVMLLNAGLGAGALAGLMAASIITRDSTRLDEGTAAITIGVGSVLGVAGMYLLIRPRGDDDEPARAAAWSPFVAPVEGGGVAGLTGSL